MRGFVLCGCILWQTCCALPAGAETTGAGPGAQMPAQAPQLEDGAAARADAATPSAAGNEKEKPPAPGADRYLEAVRSIEDEGGAYSPELSQHLFGLGIAYQKAGRHGEAVDTLNRAAHVTRVNEGLYSASDLPILERLIESYAALGDWEQVEKGYNQFYRIHYRNYGERDPRLLPALQKLSSWHMRAYLDATGGEPLNHLLTARNLYDSSVAIMQANYASTDGRIADALRQRALVDYYLASYVPAPEEGFGLNAASTAQVTAQAYMANSFNAGRDALERVVELRKQSGAGSELASSEALAELADWHQLFNRRQAAIRLYQDAWTFGSQAGEAAPLILRSVFGKPLALPVLPDDLQAPAPDAPAQSAYIKVRFSVDETGRAENMEVVESSPPAADKYVSRLRKRLLSTAFRPRFEGGQPVATPNVGFVYSYSP